MPKKNQNLLLQNKGEFTKFQILLEIMNNQPHIKQKEIADTMGITIQAISKYFKKLTKEGLLEAGSGRADYHLTRKGIGKLHDDLKSWNTTLTSSKAKSRLNTLGQP